MQIVIWRSIVVKVIFVLSFLFSWEGVFAYSGAGDECFRPGTGGPGDLLVSNGVEAVENWIDAQYEFRLNRSRKIFNSLPLPEWANFESKEERYRYFLRTFVGCHYAGMIDYAVASGNLEVLNYILATGVSLEGALPLERKYIAKTSIFFRCNEIERIAKVNGKVSKEDFINRMNLYRYLLSKGARINLITDSKKYNYSDTIQYNCREPDLLSLFYELGLDKSILNFKKPLGQGGDRYSPGEEAVVNLLKYHFYVSAQPKELLEVYKNSGITLGKEALRRICEACDDDKDGQPVCKKAQELFMIPEDSFLWFERKTSNQERYRACGSLEMFAK